jgi:rhamnogalacturonan endolyase
MSGILKFFLISIFIGLSAHLSAQSDVTATIDATARTATMSNGIVTIGIASSGMITSLNHNGTELISGGKFYLDYTDSASNKAFGPNAIRIEKQNSDYAEVVYSRTTGPIILEQGFILRKNVSGIYTYVTVKGTATATKVLEMRIVYRVNPTLFTYGYVSDRMQGQLPSVADMAAVNGTPVMDATYQLPDGTIYTKYNWTNYIVQDSVHGIMSASKGIWAIPVSHEYVNGGPMKQELTVHTTNTTPLVLQMLQGEHMGASAQTFRIGDEKIYGPFFIYVNSGSSYANMIADAKAQVPIQKAQWPFTWLTNSLDPLDRSIVSGNINITPGLNKDNIQVVLAQPGSDIYAQGKQYIYWGLTDKDGNYSIDHVRPGTYTLYTYATTGEVTDEFSVNNRIVSGQITRLDTVKWRPAKYENLLWMIGENDRMSTGFHYSDTIRQYGLYNLPAATTNYVVGTSKPEIDWYYAQTKVGTWTVTFNNPKVQTGNAVLTASIAGVGNSPNVDVYVNGVKKTTWAFLNDASVYRSAVLGGKHGIKTLTFPASALVVGQNTVKFTISNLGSRGGVIYDCIKLETGGLLTAVDHVTAANNLSATAFPNPFRDETTINLNAANDDFATVMMYNIEGKCVETLYNGAIPAGNQQLVWKPANCPPGIYFYSVKTKNGVLTGKVVLLK